MNTWYRLHHAIETWLRWTVVTSISWSLGLAVAMGLSVLWELPSSLGLGLACVIGGVGIGLAEWLVLPHDARGMAAWVGATTLGWTVGLFVATAMIRVTDWTGHWAVGGALGGMALGSAQALVLKRRLGTKRVWLALSSASWAAAYSIGALPSQDALFRGREIGLATVAASGILGWVVLGMFAALLLILLLPKREGRDPDVSVRWWP